MSTTYRRLTERTARAVGSPGAFLGAVGIIVIWAASGPTFRFGDTWQLVINTGTTIITFLMVFLIQGTQNRESRVTQLKLDELIRAVGKARNSLLDMEHMSDEDLARLEHEFEQLRNHAAQERTARRGA